MKPGATASPPPGVAAIAHTIARPPAKTDENQVANGLAPLTASAIAAQTDPGSFKRGQGYARSGHIFDPFRR